jgi:hypothetical protein
MVSSALEMELRELLDIPDRLQRDYHEDPEYQAVRRALPDEWPL